MNVLEFTQLKNDDIKCRYTSKNGNRKMGDYSNGVPIGKHARLTLNGQIDTVNY